MDVKGNKARLHGDERKAFLSRLRYRKALALRLFS
jgi:hypothetical protein